MRGGAKVEVIDAELDAQGGDVTLTATERAAITATDTSIVKVEGGQGDVGGEDEGGTPGGTPGEEEDDAASARSAINIVIATNTVLSSATVAVTRSTVTARRRHRRAGAEPLVHRR